MKKIDSYSNLDKTSDGLAKFRFKYVDGKYDDFRVSQDLLLNFLMTFVGDSSSLPAQETSNRYAVYKSQNGEMVSIKFDKGGAIVMMKSLAYKLGQDLLSASV